MNRRALLASLAVVAASLAGPLRAQSPDGGRGRGGPGGAVYGDGRIPVDQLELTLHEFHEDLKLTREQAPLFEAYADRVRALAADIARERAPRMETPTQVDVLRRLDATVDRARNRAAALEEIGDAAKALYASLAKEQRVAADPRLATIPANIMRQGGASADAPVMPPIRPLPGR